MIDRITRFNRARHAELLAAQLPKATPAILDAKVKDDAPPEDRAKAEALLAQLAEYLSQFCEPSNECVCCGSTLSGSDTVTAFLRGATFEWGIAHGEGHCRACHYPARAYHRVNDDLRFTMILQYHPSELSFNASEEQPE